MSRRTEQEWRELFDQHKASGLTAKAFCLRQGIKPKTFSVRRRQILGKTPHVNAATFIRAVSSEPAPHLSRLTLRGTYGELQFSTPPSAEWLASLLKQLS